MRAARYHGQRDVRIEEVDPAPVGPDEVRVRVGTCGICGSDLHEYVAGPLTIPDAPHPVTGESVPITIGHELAGEITEVGANVELSRGTSVAVNPIIWCGTCQYCDQGDYHLCANGGFIGLSGGGGGFAERIVVPAVSAIPIPDGVTPDVAALVEPFTVGLHAIRRSDLDPGDAVAVFGAGPIGLTIVQGVRAAGAGPIFVSEPRAARRELAESCGADVVVDPSNEDPATRIPAETDGGVDVSFEVAGVEQTVNQSLAVTRSGGTITLVSLYEDPMPVDLVDIVTVEQTLVGTAAFEGGPLAAREFATTLRYFAEGNLDPAPLITARIDLEDIVPSGFERLLDPESEAVKILVEP